MARETSPALLWRSIFLGLLSGHYCAIATATSLSFFYNFSDPKTFSHGGGLNFEGGAHMGDGAVILAKDRVAGDDEAVSRAGRVSYSHPVYLWSNANNSEVTGFSTRFSFVIDGSNDSSSDTRGTLSLFLAPFSPVKPLLQSERRYLGLFNSTTAAGSQWVVALELDAHGDSDWDTNMSYANKQAGNKYEVVHNLADGVPKILQVDYSDITKDLVVALRDFKNRTTVSFKMSVDLRRYLPREVAMGFTAATGGSCAAGLHRVLWWSFSTSTPTVHGDLPRPILPRYVLEAPANSSATPPLAGDHGRRAKPNRKVVVGCVVSVVLFVVTAQVIACLWRIRRRDKSLQPFQMPSGNANTPRYDARYMSYEELLKATDNFSQEQLLGNGGFGSFYRGIFANSGVFVAVKKVKMDSADVLIVNMSRIRVLERCKHSNLVCLLDWCTEHDTLYLVYEFVENGNLSEHLYNPGGLLAWPMRYKIVLGIGSALEYLHLHRDLPVQHGNIKPSNVMLDQSFNAKLGDFSLSQQSHRDQASQKLAVGYMDPELLMEPEQASVKSDVYSFGVVLLEIACGRPPLLPQQGQDASLVEFVWEMYQKGAILEVADRRLNGEFDEREMEHVLLVGLMCTSANPHGMRRPTIGEAMQILRSDQAVPMLLPRTIIPTPVTEVDKEKSIGLVPDTLPEPSSS